MNQPIDLYCERLDASFWAEPVNALTNFAFILAAIFAFSLARQFCPKAKDIKFLVFMTFVVGIGSFIFHTVATRGAAFGDSVPIAIFVHFALGVMFVRMFRFKLWLAVLSVAGFSIFNVVVIKIFTLAFLNGSIQYIPTILALLLTSVYAYIKRLPPGNELLLASLVFTISLIFRSIDRFICPQFPLGTHFMWHILNAVTMYYVIKGLVKQAAGKYNLRQQ